jgi:hypothetical protein
MPGRLRARRFPGNNRSDRTGTFITIPVLKHAAGQSIRYTFTQDPAGPQQVALTVHEPGKP